MAGEPQITVVGNLTADPELRFTQSGKAVASANLACNPRRKDARSQQWEEMPTMWFRVTVWGDMAERVTESLRKGDRVSVVGRLTRSEYETRDGEKRDSWEINADELSPSLRFANATVQKVARGAGGAGYSDDDPWATPAREPATTSKGGHEPSWQNEPPF